MPDSYGKIARLFEPGAEGTLQAYLQLLHPVDLAELFRFVDRQKWPAIIEALSPERFADALSHLDEGIVEELGLFVAPTVLAEAIEELETDDAADILGELPEAKAEQVLANLDAEDRDDITILLAYPQDSAGGIMQTEFCGVRDGLYVTDAIDSVREAREKIKDIHEVYLVDSDGRLKGAVRLVDLVLSDGETALGEISHPVDQQVPVDMDQEEVARLFGKYDLASIPVVNQTEVMVGRITFDDIHDVVLEEATEDVMAMAGASGEELVYGNDFLRIALFRLPWLISSLFGSLITTLLVPLFTKIPGDTIILASFVPVVMAMTGNVGSQTAMIITRGFAINKVSLVDLWRNIRREMTVGLIMGIAAGSLVGIFSLWTHGSQLLGYALSASMISSMCIAAGFGVMAPALFKKIGIDPAIAAGPLVTTGCDVLGVGIYLGVAIMVITQ